MNEDGVYVIALVGESPGVVTELLWYLTQRQNLRIAGVELWTTQTGWAAGSERGLAGQGPGMLARLRRLVPELPPWPREVELLRDPQAQLSGPLGVFVPVGGDERLTDVRSEQEARAFSVALHRRIAWLRRQESKIPPLVGSLAGGRKTMTAAMHSAFALYARRGDRLCHVLLHRAVETELKLARTIHEYAFPTELVADVAPYDQVTLVDCPFFPLAEYLAAGDRPAAELVAAARRELEGLRAEATGRVELRLNSRGHAELTIGQGVTMMPKTAVAYAWLIQAREPLTDQALANRTNEAMEAARLRNPSNATLLQASGIDRTLRTLREEIRLAAEERGELLTMAPDEDEAGRWYVRPHETLDVSALDPAAVVAALFP